MFFPLKGGQGFTRVETELRGLSGEERTVRIELYQNEGQEIAKKTAKLVKTAQAIFDLIEKKLKDSLGRWKDEVFQKDGAIRADYKRIKLAQLAIESSVMEIEEGVATLESTRVIPDEGAQPAPGR